ncbi:hypothetical protein AVEN_121271-1 [Araneus ventricosus]|uniref:Uncharacterized protein n=1 Tax=Araneus ventricosus TaxID=182803 RepID=A0A4Y2VMQ1_ARAVE|nr:hypothetical protein AVEN_121271-1 [Araneus ventricosus]
MDGLKTGTVWSDALQMVWNGPTVNSSLTEGRENVSDKPRSGHPPERGEDLESVSSNQVHSSRQLISHHCLKKTLFQISVWNPDWVPNLGCMGCSRHTLELSQQFLSFASSMGIVMQEDDTITQHGRVFVSDGLTMVQ